MTSSGSSSVPRRGFLARLSAAAAGFAAFATAPSGLRAEEWSPTGSPNDPDAWIGQLTGRDRLVFHAHNHFMPALAAARGVLTDGRDAYGVPETESSVAVASHGPAIVALFRDEIWQRFALGELYKITDVRTGAPATRNPFLAPQEAFPSDVTVTELMRRGVVFIVCNVAVRTLSRRLTREGSDPEALYNELVAGVVPGTIVVPNLYVAMSHAQRKGVSYIFID